MNIEPDIFDYLETTSLEPHDDYTSEITYKDQKIIWNKLKEQQKEIERLNKCIDEALEIIIKDWNDKCTIPIHAVVDTGDDIRIKLYYPLFFKGLDKE